VLYNFFRNREVLPSGCVSIVHSILAVGKNWMYHVHLKVKSILEMGEKVLQLHGMSELYFELNLLGEEINTDVAEVIELYFLSFIELDNFKSDYTSVFWLN
jgi:hypothetical protein